MRARPLDTSKKAWDLQFELLRRKTPEERLQMARDMTLAVQRFAFAGLRVNYPDLPDDELWLKLAARRLGTDLVRKVYGRDVDPA
ncbi:MAG TPA: hypothetical protein VND45_02560 [Thermoanaerobaculia bacterium]|jgi:predicted alpha-1,6-mannanase (GH76 family)|nr:hypothetical protein [Thermoanaerobaculia bacterium]